MGCCYFIYRRLCYAVHSDICNLETAAGDPDGAVGRVNRFYNELRNLMRDSSKVIVIMPSYNVADILEKTYNDIPKDCVDGIVAVDDCSIDNTSGVAKNLGITVVRHEKNRGYGGAQKTGYAEALKMGADIVVMVHGDYQYDPTRVADFVEPIRSGRADAVTGTRIIGGSPVKSGMPLWKYIPNRVLSKIENMVLRTDISEFHNGYRAYSRRVLEAVPFHDLSEKFDFDTDIIVQIALRNFKVAEVPHMTRYLDENSQMTFMEGVPYGLSILRTMWRLQLHRMGIKYNRLFDIQHPTDPA